MGAYYFSPLFTLDITTESQKGHKLFLASYILCNKKFGNKKIAEPNKNLNTSFWRHFFQISPISLSLNIFG